MDNTQRIEKSILKSPSTPTWRIAKNLNLRVGEVEAVRKTMGAIAPLPTLPETKGGVNLKGLKVLPRKPAESASRFIRKLPLGKGYPVKTLSDEWGIGEDTIRRHAKDMGCLKYVEVEPDEWIPVVMNPETAKQYV